MPENDPNKYTYDDDHPVDVKTRREDGDVPVRTVEATFREVRDGRRLLGFVEPNDENEVWVAYDRDGEEIGDYLDEDAAERAVRTNAR